MTLVLFMKSLVWFYVLGSHIVFDVDAIDIGVGEAPCQHLVSDKNCMDTSLEWCLIRLSDLDINFTLLICQTDKNMNVCILSLAPMDEFRQNILYIVIGIGRRLHWFLMTLNFQSQNMTGRWEKNDLYHECKTLTVKVVCAQYLQSKDWFRPSLVYCIVGMIKLLHRILVTLNLFARSPNGIELKRKSEFLPNSMHSLWQELC